MCIHGNDPNPFSVIFSTEAVLALFDGGPAAISLSSLRLVWILAGGKSPLDDEDEDLGS